MESTRRRYRDNVRSEGPQAPVAGRVPPQSLEAEESVLGSILLDNQAINVCLERIRAEDFYKSGHQTIFEAMATLSDRREPIDIVTLGQQLRSMGQLENVGGPQVLSYLASSVPNAANVGYYARVIKEMSIRRMSRTTSSLQLSTLRETWRSFWMAPNSASSESRTSA
jgi:replicative DNA helicase